MAEKRFSNLDLAKQVDAFPYEDTEPEAYQAMMAAANLYTLTWKDGTPLGYMLPTVVDELEQVPLAIRGPVAIDRAARTVHAFEAGATEAERTRAVAAVMGHWRERGTFEVLRRGWRGELWPVYGSGAEVLYSAERAGMGLLGATGYGVHMTAYVRDDEDGDGGMRIWVPRRAADKQTYPGMLDNAAAGGLMTGEEPFECLVREADEEADLPADLVRRRARAAGTVSYVYVARDGKRMAGGGGPPGQIYPESQWVYDLELPRDVRPRPKDGEVAGFELLGVAEVKEALARGEFKPNCALVTLDFFVRHGILTRENEPDYDEIVRRMHRRLPFPGPHQVAAA
ncbi:hypothetical protein SLS62_009763 [Diatrype stigma]|uniref:Nudix hydrolase domain-containing protein n=1 Tax=Diatrype stigma TaxID=117547 RepID=A0AAN9UCY9_9PEZI